MLTGHLSRIVTMAQRMHEIELSILGKEHSKAFVSRMLGRPNRKLLHLLVAGTSYLVLVTFLLIWIAFILT